MTDKQIKEVEKLIIDWITEKYEKMFDCAESDQALYNVISSHTDAILYSNDLKSISFCLIQLVNAGTLTKDPDMQDTIANYFEHVNLKGIYRDYIQACSELNDFLVYAEKYLLDYRAENDLLNYVFTQYSGCNDKNIYAKLEPYLDLSIIPDKAEPKVKEVGDLPF